MTILSVLKEEKVPFIVTKEIIKARISEGTGKPEDFYVPGDGHPNDAQNLMVFQEMRGLLRDACDPRGLASHH